MANLQNQKHTAQLSERPYAEQIRQKSDAFIKYGGYDLLESAIDGV